MRKLMAVLVALVATATANAAVINFDSVVAPPFFASVTPGGPLGPNISFADGTLTGGVILNDTAFGNGASTKPNLYATSDFIPLANASLLPGVITGNFTSTVNNIALTIVNGSGAASFTLNAFDSSNNLVASQSVNLASFTSLGFIGSLSVSGPGITKFTVTTSQPAGNKDFAIDTISYALAPVPEPISLVVFGGLVLGGGLVARRRLMAKKAVA